ncbi:unnamed protein product [Tetraodon nigroviridis]|uniref:Chromosome 6 SCAF14737, whole genome shotgun sequence n=1 Tax=Tetraodon nigroviridis TaxID=99883 RepID=Q4S506_TETNG|nr:unnamed protein product [Tetraodon nigroviridis]
MCLSVKGIRSDRRCGKTLTGPRATACQATRQSDGEPHTMVHWTLAFTHALPLRLHTQGPYLDCNTTQMYTTVRGLAEEGGEAPGPLGPRTRRLAVGNGGPSRWDYLSQLQRGASLKPLQSFRQTKGVHASSCTDTSPMSSPTFSKEFPEGICRKSEVSEMQPRLQADIYLTGDRGAGREVRARAGQLCPPVEFGMCPPWASRRPGVKVNKGAIWTASSNPFFHPSSHSLVTGIGHFIH